MAKGALWAVIAFASIAALCGCTRTGENAVSSETPVETCAFETYSAEAFYTTDRFRLPPMEGRAFSADDTRLLFASNRGGAFRLYAMDAKSGEQSPIPTDFAGSPRPISWFPQDDRILFIADKDGNENSVLYVLDTEGSIAPLTPEENTQARFASWIDGGAAFVVESNERDSENADLYRIEADGYEKSLLLRNNIGWSLAEPSPDARWAAALRVRAHDRIEIVLIEIGNPEAPPTVLSEAAGYESSSLAFSFSSDSKTLYYQAADNGDFIETWALDLATREKSLLISVPHDVRYYQRSASRRYEIFSVNDDGYYRLNVRETASSRALPAFDALAGVTPRSILLSNNERMAAMSSTAPSAPADLYLVDLESGDSRRVLDTLNPAICRDNLVAGEVVRYQSFDGLSVPAVLYKPKGASAANPAPAVVWVHGGPESQSRPVYLGFVQYLVNHGYAVLAPNYRGSGGYGKKYLALNDRRHGEGDIEDVIYGKRYVETLTWIDGDRIAVMGPSYGGFVTLSALAFHPEEFAAGVAEYGVADWVHFLENLPPWWAAQRASFFAEFGDPENINDRDRLHSISPLFAANKIQRPLFLLHGENDARVPIVQTRRIYQEVIDNGGVADLLVFPDEGHGFRKRANLIREIEEIRAFLDRQMKP